MYNMKLVRNLREKSSFFHFGELKDMGQTIGKHLLWDCACVKWSFQQRINCRQVLITGVMLS